MRFLAVRYLFTAEFTVSKLFITYDGPLAYAPGGWSASAPRGPLEFGHMIGGR